MLTDKVDPLTNFFSFKLTQYLIGQFFKYHSVFQYQTEDYIAKNGIIDITEVIVI